jgi:hypothetical protein
MFEFANVELLIRVEVADFEGFGECFFFLEDAVEAPATVALA